MGNHRFIEKQIEDVNTGVIVSCHVISTLYVDFDNNYASVTVKSYLNKEKKEQGKNPVGVPVTLQLSGVENAESDLLDWAYQTLIQPAPSDFIPERYDGYINPYTFQGGKVVS